MVKYDYTNYRLPIQAETVAMSLEEIRSKHGVLTPQAVLTEARNKDHILHDQFDWNDRTASEKYRIIQARSIINCVIMVLNEDEPVQVRAFMKTSTLHEYKPAQDVLTNKDDMEFVLQQAKSEMNSFIRKYKALKLFPKFSGQIVDMFTLQAVEV